VEYQPEWDLKALMPRQLLQIPYMKDLVKRLKRNPYLRNACGYRDMPPTEAHFSQMKKRIGVEGFRIIEAYLRHEAMRLRMNQPLTAVGLIQAACVDGTDLPALSRSLDDSRRDLGDPDARLGRRRKGFYLGYRSLFLTDVEEFPLGNVKAPANVNEALLVEPLLNRVLREDLELELLVGDSGFEPNGVFDAFEARKVAPLVAWRRMWGREKPPDVLSERDRIDVEGSEWMRVVYKRLRAVV
ncbi:transposase, partial [Candidatus Bathyarchaeota archaeon]|nr:transposase [Candidatus Bathyarchaeota archaeon]